MIESFREDYKFLSNFTLLETPYIEDGNSYITTEHYYQAMKFPIEFRSVIAEHPLKGLKKFVKANSDKWESFDKDEVMYRILCYKFSDYNPTLKEKLISTGALYIQEGNWWGDVYWGYCLKTNTGENNLGKMLMVIRDKLIQERNMTYKVIKTAKNKRGVLFAQIQPPKGDILKVVGDSVDGTIDGVELKDGDTLHEVALIKTPSAYSGWGLCKITKDAPKPSKPNKPANTSKGKYTPKKSSWEDKLFRISFGNAINVAAILVGKESSSKDVELVGKKAYKLVPHIATLRTTLVSEHPDREADDIGAKVGAALTAVAVEGMSCEDVCLKAKEWAEMVIKYEEIVKEGKPLDDSVNEVVANTLKEISKKQKSEKKAPSTKKEPVKEDNSQKDNTSVENESDSFLDDWEEPE